MTALRRDLVERKLWMVVAILVVAVAAVPVFLLKGASASTTPTVPAPAAAPASAPTSTTAPAPAKEPAKVTLARIARDPFASAVPKLSSKPASRSSSSSSPTSTTSSTTPSSSSATSTVAMVSPAPGPSSGASAGSGGSATSSSSSAPTSSSASRTSSGTGVASAPASTTPTSTIASAPPSAQSAKPAPVRSWSTYSVSVRFGKDLGARVRKNIARLTAMPSAQQPEVMFMGVMSNGGAAVFALREGVGHTGPAWCHPSHDLCSAIVLKPGETEDLTIPGPDGTLQKRMLRVVKITSTLTHSEKVAQAAFNRVSHAGLCDLLLADPMLYHLDTGTYSNVPKKACASYPKAVPFSYFRTNP